MQKSGLEPVVEGVLKHLQPKNGWQFQSHYDVQALWSLEVDRFTDRYIFLHKQNALNEFKQWILDDLNEVGAEQWEYDKLEKELKPCSTKYTRSVNYAGDNSVKVYEIVQLYVGWA